MGVSHSNTENAVALFGLFSCHWKPYGDLELSRLEKHFAKCGYHLVTWHRGEQLGSQPLTFEPSANVSNHSDGSGIDPKPWEVAIEKSWQPYEGSRSYVDRAIAYSRRVIEKLQPAVYVGWNTLEPQFGIPAAVARSMGIPVVSIEAGFLPGSIRFDQGDLSTPTVFFDAEIDEGEAYGKYLLGNDVSNPAAQEISSKPVNTVWKKSGIKVLVVGCVEPDLGIFGGFESKNCFLKGFNDSTEIANCLAADEDLSVVFRPHPLWGEKFPGLEDHHARVAVSFADSRDLISDAEVVVVAGGKLEGRVILDGKPMVRPGVGFLPCPEIGFTETDPERLVDCVKKALKTNNPDEQIKRFTSLIGILYKNGWARVAGPDDEKIEQELELAVDYALKNVGPKACKAYSSTELHELLLQENCQAADREASNTLQPQASLKGIVLSRLRSIKKRCMRLASKCG